MMSFGDGCHETGGGGGSWSVLFASAQEEGEEPLVPPPTSERTVVLSRGVVDTTMPSTNPLVLEFERQNSDFQYNPNSTIFLLPPSLPPRYETAYKQCNFAGEVVIPHSASIDLTDRFYGISKLMFEAAVMTVDYINTYRCGVHISSGNYSLRLITYGDNSDSDKIQAITQYIHSDAYNPDPLPKFLTAGYSSTMTQYVTPIAQANNRIVVTAGSARTSIYANNSYIFGMLPASALRFYWAFVATAKNKGAKSVAYLTEAGTSACSGVEEYAEEYGMELVAGTF